MWGWGQEATWMRDVGVQGAGEWDSFACERYQGIQMLWLFCSVSQCLGYPYWSLSHKPIIGSSKGNITEDWFGCSVGNNMEVSWESLKCQQLSTITGRRVSAPAGRGLAFGGSQGDNFLCLRKKVLQSPSWSKLSLPEISWEMERYGKCSDGKKWELCSVTALPWAGLCRLIRLAWFLLERNMYTVPVQLL